jgi:hypothetical protein
MVLITSDGMAAIRDAAPGHVEAVRRYFVDLLSPAEIEVLTSVCLRVSRAVGDAAP